jgi:hypothetical protein
MTKLSQLKIDANMDAFAYPTYSDIHSNLSDLVKDSYTERVHNLSKQIYDLKFQEEKSKEIGWILYDEGGIAYMQASYYALKFQSENAGILQCYWDGIGDWRW